MISIRCRDGVTASQERRPFIYGPPVPLHRGTGKFTEGYSPVFSTIEVRFNRHSTVLTKLSRSSEETLRLRICGLLSASLAKYRREERD
eukprot:scaffold27059_cov164-Skeletonema_menzelii.AAC.2